MRPDVERLRTHAETARWMTFAEFDPSVYPRDSLEWCYLVSDEATGSGEFEMGLCRLAPGGVHLRHHHRMRAELYFVTAGRAHVQLDGDEFEAGAGAAVYIPRGMTHGFATLGDEPLEVVFVYDVPAGLTRPDTFWDE